MIQPHDKVYSKIPDDTKKKIADSGQKICKSIGMAPYSNKNCRVGMELYKDLLLKPEGVNSHFCHAWLEEYIETLDKVFDEDWTKCMKKRYLGYE